MGEYAMKLAEMKILVATYEKDEMPPGAKCILAQSNEYPVRNGSGHTVDEAIEDLFLQIIVHLHNRRTGRKPE
jgi:hypothetical protein